MARTKYACRDMGTDTHKKNLMKQQTNIMENFTSVKPEFYHGILLMWNHLVPGWSTIINKLHQDK